MNEKKKEMPLIFDPISIGNSLKEISNELIETEMQNVINKWYHSHQDADLLVWLDERDNIIKQQISFLGQVVEWNIVDGVKTGYLLLRDEALDKEGLKANKQIQYDAEIQEPALQKAVQVIENTSEIEDNARRELIHNFIDSPQLSHMDPEFLVKTFGLSSKKPTFFQKILFKLIRFFS